MMINLKLPGYLQGKEQSYYNYMIDYFLEYGFFTDIFIIKYCIEVSLLLEGTTLKEIIFPEA